jgi:uncharacterized protein (DUF433 family)
MAIEIAPGIVVDPNFRHGKRVIKGTRVPVELLIGKMAGSMTAAEVAEEYGLADADVRAALAYAAQVLASEEIQATAS